MGKDDQNRFDFSSPEEPAFFIFLIGNFLKISKNYKLCWEKGPVLDNIDFPSRFYMG